MSSVGVFFQGGGKIFRIGPGRSVALIDPGAAVDHPNGITWDRTGERWIVAPSDEPPAPGGFAVAGCAGRQLGRTAARRAA
jgi:hypothetical protein